MVFPLATMEVVRLRRNIVIGLHPNRVKLTKQIYSDRIVRPHRGVSNLVFHGPRHPLKKRNVIGRIQYVGQISILIISSNLSFYI